MVFALVVIFVGEVVMQIGLVPTAQGLQFGGVQSLRVLDA